MKGMLRPAALLSLGWSKCNDFGCSEISVAYAGGSNGYRYKERGMILENGHTEFFPGRSGRLGVTLCRGWESPYGTGLVLPFSLTSVEPGQDRCSSRSQLWRDADGDLWMISYLEGPCEWLGCFMGQDVKSAQEALRANRARELQPLDAYRILAATDGLPREEIEILVKEKVRSAEFEWGYLDSQFLWGRGEQEFYQVYKFRDGSALRVTHPASVFYVGMKVIEAYMAPNHK